MFPLAERWLNTEELSVIRRKVGKIQLKEIIMQNLFEAFRPPTGKDLEAITVYEKRENNGRRFEVEYSGLCEDLVLKRAIHAHDSIDRMASPNLSHMQNDGDTFRIILTYYSVD